MSDEMILRYLYYFTHMHSGTKRWEECYNAWHNFANSLGDDYEECLKSLTEFNNKYRSKKK